MKTKTISQDQKMLNHNFGKRLLLMAFFLITFGTVNSFALAAPVAAAASNITVTSFSANWSVSVGATMYFLDVAVDTAFTTFVTGYNNLNVGNVTTYNVSGLTANTCYYYRVRAYDSQGGFSPNSNTIAVGPCGTSEIIEINKSGLVTVYPNPAKDMLIVSVKNKGSSDIVITDVLGKTVRQLKTNELQSEIDVRELQNGIYFIKLTRGSVSYLEKIIIYR